MTENPKIYNINPFKRCFWILIEDYFTSKFVYIRPSCSGDARSPSLVFQLTINNYCKITLFVPKID